jgi:hypothetical protein
MFMVFEFHRRFKGGHKSEDQHIAYRNEDSVGQIEALWLTFLSDSKGRVEIFISCYHIILGKGLKMYV